MSRGRIFENDDDDSISDLINGIEEINIDDNSLIIDDYDFQKYDK